MLHIPILQKMRIDVKDRDVYSICANFLFIHHVICIGCKSHGQRSRRKKNKHRSDLITAILFIQQLLGWTRHLNTYYYYSNYTKSPWFISAECIAITEWYESSSLWFIRNFKTHKPSTPDHSSQDLWPTNSQGQCCRFRCTPSGVVWRSLTRSWSWLFTHLGHRS